MSLDAISVPPNSGNSPNYLVIFLHGWGADYRDLVPLANVLNLPDCQFLFPNAPFPHSGGFGGRAWYALDTPDYNGIQESREMLFNWVLSLEENTGVPLNRTILAGFSQGGAMILDVGLTLPVVGLCVCSGYLHFQPQPLDVPSPPVLMNHGTQDPVVPIAMARQAQAELTQIGVKVSYHEFEGGHEIPPETLVMMQQFIGDCWENIGRNQEN
jgi:phospholipase/carboxylesterase